MTTAPAFEAWLDAFFDGYYRRRPVNATFIGVHDYDDRLPDLSAEGIAATAEDARDLLQRLRQLPPEPLHAARAIDRRLSEGLLLIQEWESMSPQFGAYANPTLWTGEAIFGVVSLLLRPFAPLEERLAAARARLERISGSVDVGMAQVGAAPAAWIERARRECAAAGLLLADIAGEYPTLQPAAALAAQAFDRFDHHLAQGVRATDTYACGAEAFELLLREAHMLDGDAATLEAGALERIALEEEALAAQPARDDAPERQITEDYLGSFVAWWRATRERVIALDLVTFPDWPVRFVGIPTWARRAAPSLYFLPYRSPAPFDPASAVDYLTPSGADESTIKLNHVIHHAGLGHHVQNWFAARAASRVGQIAAVDCASRIAMLCGGSLAEGWANYAVDLADEAGLLTPAERYSQHRAHVRMAARAVVDVRLHHGRFSLQEAIAYYVDRVGMTPQAARSEAVKNSLFPGAACMYLVGWDAIWRLRRELQARNPALSLREFHDRLLSFGSVPVSLIARAMLEATPVAALPHP